MREKLPHIAEYKNSKVFMVDGKPYFGFAGEVHNSSCSNVEYFRRYVLDEVDQLHLNTLIFPVYWEQIEEEEGKFSFEIMDGILEAVREKGLRIILLWFGLWKNALSTYVPQWVKLDRENYPFVRKQDGKPIYCITPLCRAAVERDARAFETLMGHLREVDGRHQTVIGIQVENEVGTLETDRDYGSEAEAVFRGKIPDELQGIVGKSGTWEESFGQEAEEIFMCYHFAKAVNDIAEAGKKQYELPMFVNAWLAGEGEKPGKYPSGGPVQRRIDLWRALAPSIDLCVPDIYLEDFKGICDIYAEQGFLLIPEARQDVKSISNAIYAFANYPSGCFSPFGIEDFLPGNREKLAADNIMKILNIAMEAFCPDGTLPYLSRIYRDLSSIGTLLLEKRSEGKVHAFLQEQDEEGSMMVIGPLAAQLMYLKKEDKPRSAGFVLELDENEWLIYGVNFLMILKALDERMNYGVLKFEEGHFENDTWKSRRIFNGDEQYVVSESDVPKFLKLKWHIFE